MTILSYISRGEVIKISFATHQDAEDAAMAVNKVPGVYTITLKRDEHPAYPFRKSSRYICRFTNDLLGQKWDNKKFGFLADAAQFGEDQMDYEVIDLVHNRVYTPQELACLI